MKTLRENISESDGPIDKAIVYEEVANHIRDLIVECSNDQVLGRRVRDYGRTYLEVYGSQPKDVATGE